MSKQQGSTRGGSAPPPKFRFSLFTLMLTMFAVCAASGGGYYLVKYANQEGPPPIAFVIFPIAAPAVVVVLVSLARSAFVAWEKHRRRR